MPRARAVAAATGAVKKVHTCAPAPDRETSVRAGTSASWQAAAYAEASARQSLPSLPSKSTASRRQLSSASGGYSPRCTSRRPGSGLERWL
jgi:hypothetical protein